MDANSNNNKPELLRGIKSYFYKCCPEFIEIGNITRFIEISTALHNGLYLYEHIIKEAGYYELGEDVIKSTLCDLIVALRFGDTNNTEQKESAICLFNNLNLKATCDLFSNELMQRFFYKINNEGQIEYFQKFVGFKPFCSLLKQGIISQQECLDQVTHPTGWYNITESELRDKNPWSNLAPSYIGYKLYDTTKTFALQEDLQMIEAYNTSKKNPRHHYHLEIPAEPWQGNPLTAKTIILSLNPGWEEDCNKRFALSLPIGGVSEDIFKEKRNSLLFNAYGFMPYNDNVREAFSKLGADYWKNKLETLRNEVPEKDDIDFYRNFALIQYCAYTSEKYGGGFKDNKLLPSQLYTKEVIRYIAYNRPDVKFVILRAENKWEELLDADVWFTIRPRTIIAKWPIQQLMNKSNLGEDNFESLVNIIKESK